MLLINVPFIARQAAVIGKAIFDQICEMMWDVWQVPPFWPFILKTVYCILSLYFYFLFIIPCEI
jgi:hypothetical protein